MILITGGGTGGHLAIAKSLKEAFLQKGKKIVYVGSIYGQDRFWFENDPEWSACYFLESEGVVNKRGIKKVAPLIQIAQQARIARKLLKKHKIQAVVSVGGYSAAAASFAALLNHTPLFVHEQNAKIGKLNALLKPFTKRFFCSFLPPYDPYPVREIFFQTRRIRKNLRTVIFLGGSQGARQINDIALTLAPKLQKNGVKIIHQCGRNDKHRIEKEYRKLNVDVDLFDFDINLAQKISQADLAVARAGASTVWELAANALPALFVPYPFAAGDHQRKNAEFIQKNGGAQLWHEKIDLYSLNLETMSTALTQLYKPYGAKKIVEEILTAI